MYDRATRALSDPNNKDVSEYVGPGSYEPHHRFTDRKPIMGKIRFFKKEL